MESYCLFCKSGSEQAVTKTINALQQGCLAIAPLRVVQEKRNNKWEQRSLALLPGYVFLFSEEDHPDWHPGLRVTNIYKVLQYDGGVKALEHEDYTYAMWIYNNHGRIAPSKVFCDGETIQVIDGPLLDCQGKIVRVDRHKRRVLVEFDFDGQKRVVSLGAECIADVL